MKRFISMVVIVCELITVSVFGQKERNVTDLFNAIIENASRKDVDNGLMLLDELRTLNWPIGGGVGEMANTRLTMEALRQFSDFIPWAGTGAGSIPVKAESEIRHWMRADADVEAEMLIMLSSADPVARWIACQKLRNGKSLPDAMIKRLKEMEISDDYLILEGGGLHGEDDLRPRFNAPIREEANALLKNFGVGTGEVNREQIAREGLAWLGRLYIDESHAHERRALLFSLMQLRPSTPEIADALHRAKAAETPEERMTIFRDLAAMKGLSAGSAAPKKAAPAIGAAAPSLDQRKNEPVMREGREAPIYARRWVLLGVLVALVIAGFAIKRFRGP